MSTPSGSVIIATRALRACSRKITHTKATMPLSSKQRALQVFDGSVDQVGTVVDGLYGHALRQTRGDLREAVLHIAE